MVFSPETPSSRDEHFPDSYITLAEDILAPLFPVLAKTVLAFCQTVHLFPTSVLDIGGGTGQWLEAFLHVGIDRGVLVDTDPVMLQHASRRFHPLTSEPGKLVLQANAQHLPFTSSAFDLIVSRNSMHMWPQLPECWAEIFRVLTPGGVAFIGRGYGPDLPDGVRKQIKEQRKQFKSKSQEPQIAEPPSPMAREVVASCSIAGFRNVQVIPDGKSYWIGAAK